MMFKVLRELLKQDKSGLTKEQLSDQYYNIIVYRKKLLGIWLIMLFVEIATLEVNLIFVADLSVFIMLSIAFMIFLLTKNSGIIIKQARELETVKIETCIEKQDYKNLIVINDSLCQKFFQLALKTGIIKLEALANDINFSLQNDEHTIRILLDDRHILNFLDVEGAYSNEEKIAKIKSHIQKKDYSHLFLLEESYKQCAFQEGLKAGHIELTSSIGNGVSIFFKELDEVLLFEHKGSLIIQIFQVAN